VPTTSATYRIIASDLQRSLGATGAKPQVARETAYYLAHIGEIKSLDDFLADDRIFSYAMKAFGLQDMVYAKAFMRKVLSEGIATPETFANKLADRRYREFAAVFNFAQYGGATTVFERTRQGTVDRYLRQTLEEDVGRQNEGVRLALYFDRKAPEITRALDFLADPALLKVTQVALGLPVAMSLLDLDKQVQMIEAKLAVEDLADPDKRAAFLERFTTLWELQEPGSASAAPSIVSARPLELGLGADLLASLQNLKLGGH
jgi:hypothetical protein